MRRRELISEIMSRTSISYREVARIYDSLVRVLDEAMVDGDEIRLPGIGNFRPEVSTNGHRFIKFKSYKSFRARVQKNSTDPTIEERLIYGLPIR